MTVVTVMTPVVAALAVRWLVLVEPVEPVKALERDFWAAMGAGSTVLLVLLARRRLVPALMLAPIATLLVSAAIWLRYLSIWPDIWAAAGTYLAGPLAMLAPAFLLAALLEAITERSPQP